jgi:hypothetical protein
MCVSHQLLDDYPIDQVEGAFGGLLNNNIALICGGATQAQWVGSPEKVQNANKRSWVVFVDSIGCFWLILSRIYIYLGELQLRA